MKTCSMCKRGDARWNVYGYADMDMGHRDVSSLCSVCMKNFIDGTAFSSYYLERMPKPRPDVECRLEYLEKQVDKLLSDRLMRDRT